MKHNGEWNKDSRSKLAGYSEKAMLFSKGKPWKTDIKATKEKPVLVFAAKLCAMFDPVMLKPDPSKFTINRGDDQYLCFGHDHRKCLGESNSRIQVPNLIKHGLTQKGLKEAKETKFHPRDLRPEHYWRECKAGGGTPQARSIKC